jgi:hypothetical protein
MSTLNKNPGTEAFNKVQKIALPLVVVIAAVSAVWRNDVSVALLPVALAGATLYLLMVFGWGRLFRTLGMKFWKRHPDS